MAVVYRAKEVHLHIKYSRSVFSGQSDLLSVLSLNYFKTVYAISEYLSQRWLYLREDNALIIRSGVK
jgi:hypothetical protein